MSRELPLHLKIRQAIAALREGRAAELSRVALAQAVVVLGEGVTRLAAALQDANFGVVQPTLGTSDADLMILSAHRFLVTRKPKDFELYASAYEYGLFDVSKLRLLHDHPRARRNRTVKLMLQAIRHYDLIADRSFVVTLYEDGRHDFRKVPQRSRCQCPRH